MNHKTNNIIVFDIGIPAFQNNRIFNQDYASNFPGASVIPCLQQIAKKAEWMMITADVFLSCPPRFDRAVCLSNEATLYLKKIIRMGVEPKVLTSGESPNVAWKFYHKLEKLSRIFKHANIFSGFSKKIPSTTIFHPFYWPNVFESFKEGKRWEDRKLLGMVTSCKMCINYNREKFGSFLLSFPRRLRVKYFKIIDSMMQFQDIYPLRLSLIEKYARFSEFYLFGKGWTEAIKNWPRIQRIPFANYPMPCSDKLITLSKFRFSICFENCIYPGYITEKIFDSFFAGVVPVYLGAPDITDYIPSDCFINFRKFASLEELWMSLESFSESEWNNHRDAIARFLASPEFVPFKQETVASKYFRWLTD